MGKLFGTDGIRGIANSYPVTAEMALAVGRALVNLFQQETAAPVIVIGQDTRLSGDMLAAALAAGVCSAGGEALQLGIIPTPAVAFHVKALQANAGVVISASHNPYFDNGIKVFGPDGVKLSDEAESALEKALLDDRGPGPGTENTGRIRSVSEGVRSYADFLIGTLPCGFSLKGMKIVIDCANGATFEAAPRVFAPLGAELAALFVSPDGRNINDACGSQHPEALAAAVLTTGAHIGLAFDGDGDRLIAVDETGKVLTGDQILAVCATYLSKKGLLKENKVVTTVMSNLGFKAAMRENGIEHFMAQVGDRYVLEMMREKGATVGGEDSGHMIFLDHHTTGDGLLAGLRLLEVMVMTHQPLSALSRVMTVFPQALINVDVREKPPIETLPEIRQAIEAAEAELGEKGRVLVRYSGTQPMCRVMVEGPTQAITRQYCEAIAETVRRGIGIS